MKKRISRLRGFTLIELTIAMTIFAVIAVSIYATLNAGSRVWTRANPLIEANQASRFFFDNVSRDLKNIIKYSESDPVFEGDARRISFMTLVESWREGLRQLEVARVTYSLDTDTASIKRTVAGITEGFDENNPVSSEIIKNLKPDDFAFEYCYKEAGSGEDYSYAWSGAWNDTTKIPRGVRIKLGALKKTIFIPTGELLDG